MEWKKRKEKSCCPGLVGDFPEEGGLGIPFLRGRGLRRTSLQKIRGSQLELGPAGQWDSEEPTARSCPGSAVTPGRAGSQAPWEVSRQDPGKPLCSSPHPRRPLGCVSLRGG